MLVFSPLYNPSQQSASIKKNTEGCGQFSQDFFFLNTTRPFSMENASDQVETAKLATAYLNFNVVIYVTDVINSKFIALCI